MVNSVAEAGSPEKVTFNPKCGGDEEPPRASGRNSTQGRKSMNAEAQGRMWGVRTQCG